MTQTPVEQPHAADRINAALIAFTGCIGEAVSDICSYGLTIGEEYVPFDPDPEDDCDDDIAMCSQVWVRVTNIAPSMTSTGFGGGDCAVQMSLGLEVGVLRCFDIEEDGAAPTASDVLVAAAQTMEDMQDIFCAAMECEVWDGISVGSWSPAGPLGGQYGGVWTFTVDL